MIGSSQQHILLDQNKLLGYKKTSSQFQVEFELLANANESIHDLIKAYNAITYNSSESLVTVFQIVYLSPPEQIMISLNKIN